MSLSSAPCSKNKNKDRILAIVGGGKMKDKLDLLVNLSKKGAFAAFATFVTFVPFVLLVLFFFFCLSSFSVLCRFSLPTPTPHSSLLTHHSPHNPFPNLYNYNQSI
jgi:hypothetical protein